MIDGVEHEGQMDSLVTLRAKPVSVDGTAVQFSSSLEPDEFTLVATDAMAREFVERLHHEVELEAVVRRARDGIITGGEVLSYQDVDASCTDPWAAWRRWYDEWLSLWQTS